MSAATPTSETPAWSLDAIPTDRGVDVEFAAPDWLGNGIRISLNRDEARTFARGLLAAAGDAMERTFGGTDVDAGR